MISQDKAKEIALNDAGVKASDATFTKEGYDNEDGRNQYDIEFTAGGTKYDYDIDAVSGDILSVSKEAVEQASNQQTNNTQTTDQSQNIISEQDAINAALNHAGVAQQDATAINVHRDIDDGRDEYDVEFHVGTTEYNYDIDAHTGEIVNYDVDNEMGDD
ncbi:MAG: PepSY domain-containing protein [Erysipelotrichaceae bacterium]|nr:PepSY domain-containing protein [Erysipelotrichaceae bacterium]